MFPWCRETPGYASRNLQLSKWFQDAAPAAGRALEATRAMTGAGARSMSPLVELTQAAHDRRYTRLFQS
jgi:hypothetical protein